MKLYLINCVQSFQMLHFFNYLATPAQLNWHPEIQRTKVGGEGSTSKFKLGEWFSYQTDVLVPPSTNSTLLMSLSTINPYNDGM